MVYVRGDGVRIRLLGRASKRSASRTVSRNSASHNTVSCVQGGPVIETLRVSGNSRPNSVAGAVAALLRNEGEVEVQAIGPHAINQAVKAIAIARSYVEADGFDLMTQPSFVKLELQDEERTAVRFTVRKYDQED